MQQTALEKQSLYIGHLYKMAKMTIWPKLLLKMLLLRVYHWFCQKQQSKMPQIKSAWTSNHRIDQSYVGFFSSMNTVLQCAQMQSIVCNSKIMQLLPNIWCFLEKHPNAHLADHKPSCNPFWTKFMTGTFSPFLNFPKIFWYFPTRYQCVLYLLFAFFLISLYGCLAHLWPTFNMAALLLKGSTWVLHLMCLTTTCFNVT